MNQIILASTSPYRKSLLQRLNLPFVTVAPNIDETELPGEDATALVERLAIAKAIALGEQYPNALIIGSDQVCSIDNEILGKPHTRDKAIEQLRLASGRAVTFLTGIALYNSNTKKLHSHVEPFKVHFRELSLAQIEAYLDLDQPFDCAGSFKNEAAGILLFDAMEGRDPNALTGLPLIALRELLEKEGLDPLLSTSRL
ncbi:Maf family protein [Dongshaea marina]|uniref:Maf family protein n=1 Tax=Dongshaea marina TaxID=2047966 RepID=UPI000D3EBEF6|nr:nucleoside triphosphate pyrophosphatase [Dongshaea marina]